MIQNFYMRKNIEGETENIWVREKQQQQQTLELMSNYLKTFARRLYV